MAGRGRLWLVVPLWLWFAADVTLTLAGQPARYRAGDHAAAVEANPLALAVLALGPGVFTAAALGWAALLGVLAVCWSHPLTGWLAAVAAALHVLGGCSWLVRHGVLGWALAVAYIVVASEVSWFCWRRAGFPFRPSVEGAPSGEGNGP